MFSPGILMWFRCQVAECDSFREEAAPVPGGLSLEAAVAPPRGPEGKDSMCWVTGVFDDFQTPLSVDVHYLQGVRNIRL